MDVTENIKKGVKSLDGAEKLLKLAYDAFDEIYYDDDATPDAQEYAMHISNDVRRMLDKLWNLSSMRCELKDSYECPLLPETQKWLDELSKRIKEIAI